MEFLPELDRVSLSLVGKGVGPAILIEIEKPDELVVGVPQQQRQISQMEENKFVAAMKMFVDRVVVGLSVCPYMNFVDAAPAGLEDFSIEPAQVAYRVCGFSEVCHVLSSFWNCVCELLATEDAISSTVLVLPLAGDGGDGIDPLGRFGAISELISRSLCLYQGDAIFELLHFHPQYDRQLIFPADLPAHGHIPPLGYLRPMLRFDGRLEEADSFSDREIYLSNFQRRSPVPAVAIKRISMLDAATAKDPSGGLVELVLENGEPAPSSGIPTYSRNAVKLALEGEESLIAALEEEIAVAKG